jgi:hypothetical protein
MGQRFQIFIKILNPLKKEGFVKEVNFFDSKGENLKRAKQIFGEKKHSVIVYHNQWLYGLTAVAILTNLMEEVMKASGTFHPLSKDYEKLQYPTDRNKPKPDGFLNTLTPLFNFQKDLRIAEMVGRYGEQGSWFIGDECYDENGKKKYGDIREDCTMGDNNDGIMIVDAVEKKYCFMNINNHEKDCQSASELPSMKPVSAVKYATVYYPVVREKLGKYTIFEKCKGDEKEIQEVLEGNNDVVTLAKEMTEKFEVLSLKEVAGIFPKNFKKKVVVKK